MIAYLDLTHEWQECLAAGELPLLPPAPQHGLHALPVLDVRLVERPVAVVLGVLVPRRGGQHVGLEGVLGLVAQPVGRLLPGPAQRPGGQLGCEVVL